MSRLLPLLLLLACAKPVPDSTSAILPVPAGMTMGDFYGQCAAWIQPVMYTTPAGDTTFLVRIRFTRPYAGRWDSIIFPLMVRFLWQRDIKQSVKGKK